MIAFSDQVVKRSALDILVNNAGIAAGVWSCWHFVMVTWTEY